MTRCSAARTRFRAWGVLVVALGCAVAGCAGAVRGRIEAPAHADAARLRVGMPTTSPPFAAERDGTMVGIEPDLARELSRELGRGIEIHGYEFEELIAALRAGDVDLVMAGLTATPLRALRIDFSESYLTTGQRMLVRRSDAEALSSPERVRGAGARVGVLRSSTGEQYARARLAPAPVREYATVTDATSDLADGSLDVVVCDAPIVEALARARAGSDLVAVGEPLTRERLAWGVRRGDDPLRQALDAALERIRNDGRLARIVARWTDAAR